MNRPTVRQLEYVTAVAEHLHFRRAAEACSISQPALSAQIQQLEESLDMQLFERDRRQVLITDAGQEIVARAHRILADLDALAEIAQVARKPLSGTLHMGIIPTIAPYLLPRVLPAVRDVYPELKLILREDQTSRLLSRLGEGKLDVLLLAIPVDAAFVEEMALFDEQFVLAAPPDHPLMRTKSVREDQLCGHGVLLLEDGHCLRDQALSVCTSAGAEESEQVRATSLNTLTQMVANGLGITLLPEMAVAAETHRAPTVVTRKFRKPAPGRKIGLMWRASSARASEFRLLGELIQAAWRENCAQSV